MSAHGQRVSAVQKCEDREGGKSDAEEPRVEPDVANDAGRGQRPGDVWKAVQGRGVGAGAGLTQLAAVKNE